MVKLAGILLAYPWLAFVPASFFAWLYNRAGRIHDVQGKRRVLLLAATIAWAAYGWYEMLMLTRVLCSNPCNIRIDLLLIYPALVVVTLLGLWQGLPILRKKT